LCSKAGYAYKRRHIRRIGTGEQINIWNDPWVPGRPNSKITTERGGTLLTKVNELIDPASGTWDEQLITSIFNPIDARRILLIPMNYDTFEHFLAWHYSNE